MKVLLITWACDLEDVSEPEVAARWVNEISKDHEVTVFAVSRPERYGCVKAQFPHLNVIEWMDSKVPKCLVRFRAIVKPAYFLYYFRARKFISALIQEQKFDVIHHLSPFAWRYPTPAYGLSIPVIRGPVAGGLKNPPGFKLTLKEKLSPFMLLRGTDSLRMRFDFNLRRAYKRVNHLLLATNYMVPFLSKMGLPMSYSVEVEHGLLDLPQVNQFKKTAESLHFLYVGRVVKFKGLEYAIRGFAKARQHSKAIFTVVGDGPDLVRCKRIAQEVGIADRIHFLGWRSKPEVADLYASADVMLFPSYREPTGGVPMEAMSYGIPVITCAYGGTDFMVDEYSGIKIEPVSDVYLTEAVANAIDQLITDEAFRLELASGARKRAEAFFSWEFKRKRMTALYEKVVQEFQSLH